MGLNCEHEDREKTLEPRDTIFRTVLDKYEIRIMDHKSYIDHISMQSYRNSCVIKM
jgi:hypothetical protein